MPGARGDKQESHRAALLRNSVDSSTSPSSSGLPGQSPFAARHPPALEADTTLPNTIDAFGSTRPHDSVNVIAAAPAPASGRLVPLHAANGHPLAPSGSEDPPVPARHSGSGASALTATAPTSGSAAAAVGIVSSGAAAPGPHGSSPVRSMSSLSGRTPFQAPASCAAGAVGAVTGVAAASGGAAVGPVPLAVAASADSASCGRGARGGPLARSGSSGQMGSGSFPPECRICLLAEPTNDLVTPCHCTGSLAYAHFGCLKTWVIEKRSIHCELCSTMYKEPYGSELAASIPPAPPPPPAHAQVVRRLTTPDGQQIIIMPVGVGLGPGAIGPLLQHQGAAGNGGPAMMQAGVGVGVPDARDLEPQPLCEWRNMWSYALILLLLLFAIIYVTVIAKRGRQEPWMMTLWQVLLVVLPIYLVLRVAFDLYRHRLAQQLAAANLQAMALANAAADAAAAAGHPHPGAPRDVIITRAGNRVLVLQRAGP